MMKAYLLAVDRDAVQTINKFFPELKNSFEEFGKLLFFEIELDENGVGVLIKMLRKNWTLGRWGGLREARWKPRAVFYDMDMTVIGVESLVVLAKLKKCEKAMRHITDAAMRGEIPFADALARRLQMIKGITRNDFDRVEAEFTLNAGVPESFQYFHSLGIKSYIATGGFRNMVEPLAKRLGADGFCATELAFKGDKFTGHSIGPIVDGAAKADFVINQCKMLGARPTLAATVGDGANDREMSAAVGVAVGFCPKAILIDVLTAAFDSHHDILKFLTCNQTRN